MSYTTIILIIIALLALSWLQPRAIKNNKRREAERRKAERARERERARAARAARPVSARRTAPAKPTRPDAVQIAREYKIIANLILQSDKLTAQIRTSERKGDGLADALKHKQDAINAEIEARQKKLREI